MKTVAVILSAGESKRLGTPKQNIQFRGESLLARSIRVCEEASCTPVVVTGAHSCTTSVDAVHNSEWREGMATSIRVGVAHARTMGPDRIVICAVDQLLDGHDLTTLIEACSPSHASCAQWLDEGEVILGIPACFSEPFFDPLESLGGDVGARYILRNSKKIIPVAMPNARFDLDDEDDLFTLRQKESED